MSKRKIFKFVPEIENGKPVFNEQGKIVKGKHYSKPDLNQKKQKKVGV